MTEYYLIYYAEKGKPKTATHAAILDDVSQELAVAIKNEIKAQYGNETFDVILSKKKKLPVSDALKLKHLVDAYYYDSDDRWRFQQNRVLYDIECWIDDLKTLQDDPNVVWESAASPSVNTSEVYYLFAHVNQDVRTCVKVAGKTQAIAAFHYAKQEVEHLLDHDTCYGKGVSYQHEDCNGVHSRDELEGVTLATQVRLSEKAMNSGNDNFDVIFIRSVIDFCRANYPTQIQAEQNVPIEYETMYSAAKKEPDEMVIVDYDSDAYEKMVLAKYEAGLLLKYVDKIDEWHIVSKRKYGGKGFAPIARTELERQVKNKKRQNYSQADVDNLAREVERKVKARREKLGITENE